MRRAAAMLLVSASLGAGVARAQTPETVPADQPVPAPATATVQPATTATGRTVYEAAFFQPFSPTTALDIVRRVPGFTLDVGDTEVRGFGGAAGNVVINGSRPSSKDDTLDTILSRIPAQRVLRVEIGSGDQFGAEFAGRAQVVNLVLSAAGGLAGNVVAELRRDFSGAVRPQGSASALLRRGPSTFNVSVEVTNTHTPEEGTDTLTNLPSGSLFEFREKYNDISDRAIGISASWALDQGENRSAHLNGRYFFDDFRLAQTNDVFPVGGTNRNDTLLQDYHQQNYEIGGDITRPLWGGGLKIIGLITRRHRDNLDNQFNIVSGATIGGFEQFTDDSRDESVVRVVWSDTRGGWTLETGVEGALNRLRSDTRLFSVGAGGVRTRIDLPIDEATVTEYRGEAFFNAGRQLAPNFRLDAGLTLEVSRLTVSGDADAERSLRFLKPRLVLDWRPGGGWRTQLSLQRTVSQLNFYDFISAAELSNDRVTGGNADLLPQRAWEALLTVERPILGDGAAKLELGYQRIQLLQDRVPTPEGFDAPGNLGNGTMAFVRGTLDIPLARFGLRGARLQANGTLRDTSVIDPYTLRARGFSGWNDWEAEVTFRQDLRQFAWGFSYFGQPANHFYRLNEIDEPDGFEPFIRAFVEYRMDQRTTFTLTANNLFEVPGVRGRTFYTPDRRTPLPFRYEFRERNGHTGVWFRLRRSFG